jgi:hypothetical protein
MAGEPRDGDLVAALGAALAYERGTGERVHRPVDGLDLFRRARRHGVLPVLTANVEALRLERPAVSALLQASLQHRRRLDAMLADLAEVLDALDSTGVRVLVLKGVPLAVRSGGSPSSRAVGDIDLLIADSDLPVVHDLLCERGWRRKTSRVSGLDGPYRRWARIIDHHEVFVGDDRSMVEVHWRLNQTLSTRSAFEDLLARADVVDVNGSAVPVLGAVDDMALVATHASRHVFTHLKWAVDVARSWCLLSPDQRLESLEVAEAWSSGRAHRMALGVVDRLGLLDDVPAAQEAARSMVDSDTARLVELAIEHPEQHRQAKWHRLRVRAALQETWPDRGRLLGEILLPTDVLADPRVPAGWSLLAAPLRPLWRWRSPTGHRP